MAVPTSPGAPGPHRIHAPTLPSSQRWRDCDAWLQESADLRTGRSDLTKWRLIGAGPPNLSKADMEQLDRLHPERSFTGRTATAETQTAAPSDDDLVDKLERLRALRDDNALTAEEFEAAKARLLRQD